MKNFNGYQTFDGQVFTDERKARDHETDLLGEALDALIPNDDRGNITRTDRHNVLMKMVSDPNIKCKIARVYDILNFNDTEED